MPYSKNFADLKPGKAFFKTLLFLVLTFFVSAVPLFLGFALKLVNPAEYGLTQGAKADLEVTYKEILFFFSIVFAFFVLSFSYRYAKHRIMKMFLISLAGVYLCSAFLMILIDSVYYLIFAYRITFSAVQTVLNTDSAEAAGFAKLYASTGTIVLLLIFIFLFILAIRKWKWFIMIFSTNSFFVFTGLLTVVGVIDFIQLSHSKGNGTHNMRYWDIIIGEYNEYREFNRRLKAELNRQGISNEYSSFYKKDTLPKTLILVISESLSKSHMSLYGYERKTTPNLDSAENLYRFNDCITLAAMTIDAVPGLFFNGNWTKKINLITLLNKQGYETSWISNQSGWGKGDRTIVLLSQLCKNAVFMDELADDNKSNSSQHYDEDVLGMFSKALNTPSKNSRLIVLHLMGCHFDYEKRYPVDRSFFKDASPAKVAVSSEQIQKNLNAYDNAMRYHDSIVNQILILFSKNNPDKNSALMFLADHGEELYENRNHAGHGFPPTKQTAEIPCFAMLSPGFRQNYPELEMIMRKRVNTPYSNANNFYTLLQLLNIDSKKHWLAIAKNSFFSPHYDSLAPRMIMGIDYMELQK